MDYNSNSKMCLLEEWRCWGMLDEFAEEMPAKKEHLARGLLSEYADTGLWEKEKTAWEKAVAGKYADA